jgi:phosphoribosyl-ATP pyrophosphohydrolase
MQEMLRYAKRINDENERKKLFSENDAPAYIAKRIQDEAEELVESIENDAEAFGVGREIGDVLYLSFLLCAQLGFNPKDLLDITIARNQEKYPPEKLREGNYQDTIKQLRQEWKDRGDDIVWSHTLI